MIFSRKKLQIRMIERDITVPQLAKGVGVSPQAVHGWLNNEAVPKSIERLGRIATFLGVPITALLENGDGEENIPGPAVGETEEDYEMLRMMSQRLRWLREEMGVTVGQFAARFGVPVERWQDVEDGKTRPTLTTLKRICVDQKINLGFLIFGRVSFRRGPMLDRMIAAHPEILDQDPEADDGSDDEGGGSSPILSLPTCISPLIWLVGLGLSAFVGLGGIV